MATVEAPALMTTEQLLALPDDGVERWLIRGHRRGSLFAGKLPVAWPGDEATTGARPIRIL
jgi:hypothetical protein